MRACFVHAQAACSYRLIASRARQTFGVIDERNNPEFNNLSPSSSRRPNARPKCLTLSLNTTVDTEAGSLREVAPETSPCPPAQIARAERWLENHLQAIALAVTAAGLVVRIAAASGTYLIPDEALQYAQFNQPSALRAYEASRSLPHPPLFYFLFYFWHLLGRSELMLRLPSVLLGTALCWVSFKWIENLLGKAAGLIGLIVITFCPAFIALSSEVRQYALFLFCMVTALYFLGQALEQKSVGQMWAFSVFLYLAILSHYSAFFFAVSVGLYFLARMPELQSPRKVQAAWLTGQIGAVVIYVFLYLTHLSKLKRGGRIAAWGLDLEQAYFRSYRDDIFVFTGRRTLEIFRYLFLQPAVSKVMLLVFMAGVAFLFFRDLVARKGKSCRRLGMLFSLPFLAIWVAAIAGIYPYVATRHTVFLAPFVIAGSSFLFAALCRQRLVASLLIAGLLMAVANSSGWAIEPGLMKANQRRALMIAAMDHVQRSIPRDNPIFVDYQSSLLLAYYLCGPDQIVSMDTTRSDFYQFNCNGFSIVSVPFWKLRPEALESPFERMARTYGLKAGDRVWIVQAGIFQSGSEGNLLAELPQRVPQFHCVTPKTFGENITIVPLMVGPDFAPVPQANCSN
jgi:uncharacterized membrane protein